MSTNTKPHNASSTTHCDIDSALDQLPQFDAVIDVRSPGEFAEDHIPGAINLPLSQMRERVGELSKDRPVLVYCGVGQRAYFATRFLLHHGYSARNLPGGFATYQAMQFVAATPERRA